ncbi:hypothetical protein RHMOL_Rhmol02G0174300 [Rhododendron molle]|uniref:Uncharacterized protein n=1 Tax=Rhododendron molle TaxID=49168 RepID=A0ACC0PSN4_RHOML|nr:hypothetical protein RHMOL_Rhmol02G0174300 [Rhododendron molle]
MLKIVMKIRMLQMTVQMQPMMLATGPTLEMEGRMAEAMRLIILHSTFSTMLIVIRSRGE